MAEGRGAVVLGSGFVGAAVAAELAAHREIGVLDLPTHPVLAERSPVAAQVVLDEIERLDADVVVNTSGLLRGTDEVMHAANVAWPTWLVEEVLVGRDVRFVHLGSAAEYGDPGSAEPVPETAPVHPSGVYGETKWAGSHAVLAAREAGMDAVVARGFNLVASTLPPVSPLHQFLTDVRALPPEGGEVDLWWPETLRDFIVLDDLAAAVARLAVAAQVPDIVNICSGIGVRFAAIVEALAERRGLAVSIRSLDRPGIPAVVGDPTRMRSLTGVEPEMSAELIAARIDPA
ncbi:MAG TPA: NAD(P)-dependent oxidoreductase [Microthrixaceae bacterium]|nr:NAD(P)-dependent oxidoreductase [Microthrixaceae bacterium]